LLPVLLPEPITLNPSWQVTTPRPLWASATVLVESFEAGLSVAHFTRRSTPANTEIVALGVDTYLGMLLRHNFVHTDLHPGVYDAAERCFEGSAVAWPVGARGNPFL
jgi:predicted unusual protein kinase regulating ubiquinone biosynthesis (AarF/ABC1/UbiB family)